MTNRLFPLLAIAAAFGVFFVYIDPTYEEVRVLQGEVGRIDEALDTAQELERERDELLARVNELPQDDLARLEKLLPDHIDNVRLVIDLSSVAARHGMSITGVDIRTKDVGDGESSRVGESDSPLGSVEVSFSTTAPYTTFLVFLRDLEESLRILDVVDISFDATEARSYTYDVGIRTYWLR